MRQPGDDYRHALSINGDDCIVVYGEYESTYHPIVNNASETVIYDLTVKSYDGYAAVNLLDGNSDSSTKRRKPPRGARSPPRFEPLGRRSLGLHDSRYFTRIYR